ncbi:hypothetical protein AURDEDRAFT_165002 [Auricularia subglabra TFB-10046 SS5]|nr:hypothetical protein AURDEDRAFT_165002 [Auricularia subglabra TFB-10046 SS5]
MNTGLPPVTLPPPPPPPQQPPPVPRMSRAELELEEAVNASPGTRRRRYARLQAELVVAKRKALPLDERNKERARRRLAGEVGVSDDEEEELDVTLKKAMLVHAGTVNRARAQGVLFAQVAGVDEPDDLLFTEGELVVSDPYTDKPPTPPAVLDLLKAKVYIPLRVFTTPSLIGIARGELCKIISVPVRSEKKQLMDVSSFNEKDMTQADFFNAWTNLLRILQPRSDEATYEAIAKTYYARLIAHEDFAVKFQAYFHFDMSFRLKWFTEPFKITDLMFARLPNFLASDASRQEEVEKAAEQAVQRALAKYAESPRWSPYPSPGPSSSHAAPPARGHSFRGSFGAGSGSFSGTCLVCGGTGHKAAQCVAKAFAGGGILFTKWDGFKIVRIDNGAYICAAHNTRGCTRFNHDGHVCSLCGSPAHAAHNASCGRRA